MDAPQGPCGLADKLDGLVKAFVILFHSGKQVDALVQRPYLHGEFHALIGGGGSLLFPLCHAQAVAGDDVGRGSGLLLGSL